ncbi:divalent-cation tolerance protein CutA [Lysobacter humi (ex Lee et al. 2017)]
MPALVVHCTCPDAQVADRIATALVDARLAACVQQLPALRSTYRWEGRVEQAQEVLLLIKTATDRLDAVIASVRALHPYELPELLAVEACGGLPEYLDWVVAQSRADA